MLIQCCADAWHYTNVVCLPALKSSTAPVFSQCRPSDVPTLSTMLIGSIGIILGLQPERYRAGCKHWQYTDFSAWGVCLEVHGNISALFRAAGLNISVLAYVYDRKYYFLSKCGELPSDLAER